MGAVQADFEVASARWERRSLLRGWPAIGLVVGVALGQVGWGQAVLWLSGRIPVGEIDRELVVLSIYAPFALVSLIVGVRIGLQSLDRFWPATGWPDSEREHWVSAFTEHPASLLRLVAAMGVLIGVGTLAAAPGSLLGPEPGRWATYLAYLPAYAAGYGVIAVGTLITVRWLRLVARIHRDAKAIDPFDRGPIYAFSQLTGWGGLTYVVGTYFTLAFNSAFGADNAIAIGVVIISIAVGALVFVVPLWGIHARLVQEKARLLGELEVRTNRLAGEMYERIDRGAFDATKAIGDSLDGLAALRTRLEHLPTWPWPPQLLRGFVSALVLPLAIYLLTRLIANLI